MLTESTMYCSLPLTLFIIGLLAYPLVSAFPSEEKSAVAVAQVSSKSANAEGGELSGRIDGVAGLTGFLQGLTDKSETTEEEEEDEGEPKKGLGIGVGAGEKGGTGIGVGHASNGGTGLGIGVSQ